jgi:phospholipid-binding lipoprotein MlaA
VTRARIARACRLAALAALVAAMAGCATVPSSASPGQKVDPFEAWNRKVFAFNDGLDEAILKPVATVYAEVVPAVVRRGVENFYANMSAPWTAVNSLLQGKVFAAVEAAFSFGVNTVFGFAGLLDLSSEMGIERRSEDFGQTLGVWGADTGAFLVWPLIGPSTVRDSIGLPLDYLASPMNLLNGGATPVAIWTLRLVNTRANLLGASRMLDDMALDKYTFVRDAFLQRRRSLVFDGLDEPPADPSQDETTDPAPALPAAAPAASEAAK